MNQTEQIKKLAGLEQAKLLVVSDSHGWTENLEYAIRRFGKDCDAIAFLGDGMEDLVSLIELNYNLPNDQTFMPPAVFFVSGNGDDSSVSISTDQVYRISVPMQQFFVIAGKKVLMTHGHLYGVYYSRRELVSALEKNGCQIGLFGHTHVPFQDRLNDILLLNPGSVSVPRNHSDRSCAVLTINKNEPEVKYVFHSLEH